MCFYALFSFQRVRVYACKFCGAAALCARFTCCGSVHLFTICAPDGSPAAALPVCFASIRTNVLFLRIYALIFGKCKVLRSFVRKNLHISKICCTFALEIENN